MNFGPRRVSRSHVRLWYVEALDLARRRAVAFLTLGLGAMAIELIDGTAMLLPCVFPPVLALGCTIAKSADDSTSVLTTLRQSASSAWARVFIVGASVWLLYMSANLVHEAFGSVSLDPISAVMPEEASAREGAALWTLVEIGCYALIGVPSAVYVVWNTRLMWFIWTLCAIAELPLPEALAQAEKGAVLNGFVVWPYALGILTMIPVMSLPALFVPWLAITTSAMYVAYRDVWLGRAQNHPANAFTTVAVAPPTERTKEAFSSSVSSVMVMSRFGRM